ncbi:hypothetical protein HaLaN_25340, partial [Haematococcus lacustris]
MSSRSRLDCAPYKSHIAMHYLMHDVVRKTSLIAKAGTAAPSQTRKIDVPTLLRMAWLHHVLPNHHLSSTGPAH